MKCERAIPHRFSNWIYPWRDTVFYGWYRVRVWSDDDFWSEIVKNKQVKQMICNVLNEKHGLTFYSYMGFAFERTISPIDYSVTDCGLHKDCRPFICGVYSVTAGEQQCQINQ